MRDVSLAYKVLKQTNTYAYRSLEKISFVRQAIIRIGFSELKRWIQFLVIYQDDEKANGGNKVLANNSLVRANLCKMLALKTGQHNVDDYYMLGLFSLIDLILKRDPVELFHALPVSTIIVETLCGKHTEMKPYLQIARALEEMKYEEEIQQAEQLGIEKKELSDLALRAVAKV